MISFRGEYVFRFLSAGALLILLVAVSSSTCAQNSTVNKSFDFRNGAQGWQAGFADYAPGTDKNGSFELLAEIRNVPTELGTGTAFYLQGNNHSDDLFMFLKRRLNSGDGIVAGQTYQITFTLVFGSNAPSGCIGIGGSPGEGVFLKAGGSPAEPLALLDSKTIIAPTLLMNVDKANQSLSGIAASVTGNIANGQPCGGGPANYVSMQRTHQHTSLVNANSKGELWLLVGTDSGYELTTALYYQRIDVTLVPVSQQPPVLLTYVDARFQNTGRASALDSVSLLSEPFRVFSEQNFFSPDQRTRINLFAYNLELKAGEDKSVIAVEVEDSQHHVYGLPVEAVNEVPNFNWITQVTVRLPDEVQAIGDAVLRIKLRGVASQSLPVQIN